MRILLVIGFVLLAHLASAQTTTSTSTSTTTLQYDVDETGSFETLTEVRATSIILQQDGKESLLIYATGTLGSGATLQCQQSGDHTNWTNVGSSVTALGVICNVTNPIGWYRVNQTACSSCSIVPKWRTTILKVN